MAETAEKLNPETDLTPVKPQLTGTEMVVHDEGEFAMLFDTARFNQAYRAAVAFSKSKLVPAHFQGAPEACFVALHMAVRMNLDPMMVMQKTYIIQGRPGMEAQLIIALVNARGPFSGPIQWRFEGAGKDRKCTAYATHAKTGELCEMPVDWSMVEAEGWASKAGSKWKTMPEIMFRYRSATFLARLYCPEVIMGLSTVDELQDMEIIEAEIIPTPPEPKVTQTEKIKGKLKALKQPSDPPPAPTPPEPEPEAGGNSEKPPQGITEAQRTSLNAVPGDIYRKACEALNIDPDIAIPELDCGTAEMLVKHLESV